MTFTASQMVFKDNKETAKADHDNPKIIGGTDNADLNHTEGYKMLFFAKSLANGGNEKKCSIILGSSFGKDQSRTSLI